MKLNFSTTALFTITICLVAIFGFWGPKMVSSNNNVEVIVGLAVCTFVAILIVTKIALQVINYFNNKEEE